MSAAALSTEVVTDLPEPVDAELVERFVDARNHDAFAELVRRHGPVVLGVCRRVLNDPYEIDDVFQATFLVLVRDAAKVRQRKSLASWLYGVAYRLALHAVRKKHRRREMVLVDDVSTDDSTFYNLTHRHDQQIVDAELNALPERYRQALVLRFLAEKSPGEIASELGITVGAVDGLLKRGKNELRTRLLKRGVTLGAALVSVQFTQQLASAAETTSLIDATIQASLSWDLGSNKLPTDLVSDRAVELAGKEGIAMTTAMKATLTISLTVGAMVAGFGASAMFAGRGAGNAEAGGLVTTMPVARAASDAPAFVAAATDEALDEKNDSDPKTLAGDESIASEVVEAAPDPNLKRIQYLTEVTERLKKELDNEQTRKSRWDFQARNPRVAAIERSLRDTTEVNFTDIPLKDALDYLEELHKIEILPDKKTLTEEGVATDTTVTLIMSGISLRSVLRLLLEPLDLDYIIENEVLLITTRTKANETLETRVYRTNRLPQLTPKELAEIITSSIEPNRWVKNNANSVGSAAVTVGNSVAAATGNVVTPETPASTTTSAQQGFGGTSRPTAGSARVTGNTLVIRQTQRIHGQIVDLLNQLEEQADDSPNATKTGSGNVKP